MNEINLNSEIWYNFFQKGEEAGFDALFRAYFVRLTLFANRIVVNTKTAEDIVQDCFVLLWERRERLEHIKAIKSYLYTTVRNQSLKYLERQNRMGLSDNGDTLEGNVEKSIIAAETAQELYQLISTLSPALQQIIRLYYLEEKSSKEIAEILKLQPDTVTRQRLRAIIALRKTKISF